MTNILEDLWCGRVDPYAQCKMGDTETQQLELYIERHKASLLESMTDTQKDTFLKFVDCCCELSDVWERKIFCHNFALGVKIATTSLQNCNE